MKKPHCTSLWISSLLLMVYATNIASSEPNLGLLAVDGAAGRSERAVAKPSHLLWPNATIPYLMDTQFTVEEKASLLYILSGWTNDSCVRFVEWDGGINHHKYYVYFMKTKVQTCYSKIGLHFHLPMPQIVYLHPRCFTSNESLRTVSHEIGHLLGFFHEHNRPDRDKYIDIVWENVRKGSENQFEKRHTNEAVSFDSPYDFGSVMQYPLDHASIKKGIPTMVKKVRYDGPVGVNKQPSKTDIQQLNYLYHCIPYIPSNSESGESGDYAYYDDENRTNEMQPIVQTHTPTTTTKDTSSTTAADIIQRHSTLAVVTTPPIVTPTTAIRTLAVVTTPPIVTPTTAIGTMVAANTSATRTTVSATVDQTPQIIHSTANELMTGKFFGLKKQYSPLGRHYWLTCNQNNCKAKRCPGKDFNKQKQNVCLYSKFAVNQTQSKVHDESVPVYVGDIVSLEHFHSEKCMVNCPDNGVCKMDHTCFSNIKEVNSKCQTQLVRFLVMGKETGDRILNNDLVEINFVNDNSWIECPLKICKEQNCNTLKNEKCKRQNCSLLQPCIHEKFQLYIF